MRNVEDLQRRISQLPDEQLLDMLTTERVEYRQHALDLAAKELLRRGVDLPPSLPQPELTQPLNATFGNVEAEREKRRDQLVLLVALYAFLALIAWGFYTDSSEPTRYADEVIYWVYILLLISVIFKICRLLGRILLKKA